MPLPLPPGRAEASCAALRGAPGVALVRARTARAAGPRVAMAPAMAPVMAAGELCLVRLGSPCAGGPCACAPAACRIVRRADTSVRARGALAEALAADFFAQTALEVDPGGLDLEVFPGLRPLATRATSVELRMLDAGGQPTRLPPASTVREQVDHWVRSGMPLFQGCVIKGPAGLALDALVVRTVPSGIIVACEDLTRVSFDDRLEAGEEASTDPAGEASAPLDDEDAAAAEGPLRALRELIVWPVAYAGTSPLVDNLHSPRGILLHGPPGTGKSRAVEIVGQMLEALAPCKLFTFDQQAGQGRGEEADTEERLRDIFARAEAFVKLKSARARALVLVDNLDTLCPVRTQDAGPARTVAQLLTLMDGLHSADRRILVLGTTSRADDVDSALRRPGRFEREIAFAPPTLAERKALLGVMVPPEKAPLDSVGGVDGAVLDEVARLTVGFTAGDLDALVTQALLHMRGDEDQQARLSLRDFDEALRVVGATGSLLRGGAALRGVGGPQAPSGSRIEVFGYAAVKLELAKAIEWPVQRAAAMRRLDLSPPRGILLHGPPGCSKTTLARSVAAQAGHSFFALSGADVYSPFVGDAERTVRGVFAQARLARPAVVFLDELDALVGKRAMSSGAADEATSVQSRVLSTLLNEMDGLDAARGILVLAATNRLDMVDAALLRPGRFDRVLRVPLPDLHDRRCLLAARLARLPLCAPGPSAGPGPLAPLAPAARARLAADLARAAAGLSGAQIDNRCREAAALAVRRGLPALPEDLLRAALPAS